MRGVGVVLVGVFLKASIITFDSARPDSPSELLVQPIGECLKSFISIGIEGAASFRW